MNIGFSNPPVFVGIEPIIACRFDCREELFEVESKLGSKQEAIQLSILNES
jgi:hypothetical protein